MFAERGEEFHAGDVIMHNSPYYGASHGPDVAFCVPVFDGSKLIGFSVTTAHHLDIGALVPGSCGIVDAVDAYAEGLQFKAIKVYDRGIKNQQMWQLLRTTYERQRWSWAIWKRRYRLHEPEESVISNWCASTGWRGSRGQRILDGLFRKDAAARN